MVLSDQTNDIISMVVDGTQFIVLLVLLCVFVFHRRQQLVSVKIYRCLLAFLFVKLFVKLMLNVDQFMGGEKWYSPYIMLSIMVIPIVEGLLYSLYRQGQTFQNVFNRILKGEVFFLVLMSMAVMFGFSRWLKYLAYTYTAGYAFFGFVFTLIHVRLFDKQLRYAYSVVHERSLVWIRRVLWTFVIILVLFTISMQVVDLWMRIAYDIISTILYAVVGYFLLQQKPIDNSLLDQTRMFLYGNMIDHVQVRLIDSKEGHRFKEVSQKIDNTILPEIGKRMDRFLDSSTAYLNPEFNIADLSAGMNMDGVAVSFYLSYEVGTEFYSYINDYRLDYAERLLASEPTISDEDLCNRSGFGRVATMEQLFAQRYNCTVSEYRQCTPISYEDILRPLYHVCEDQYPGLIERLEANAVHVSEREKAVLVLVVAGYSLERAAGFLGTTSDSLVIALGRLRARLGLLHTDSLREALMGRL